VYLVNARLGVPLSAATSSFTVAILFDYVAIAPLVAVAGIAAGRALGLPGPLIGGFAIAIAVASLLMIAFLPHILEIARRALLRAPIVGRERRERFAGAIESLEDELARIREARIYGRVFVLSLLVRVAKYAALYVFLFALLAPRGWELSDLGVGRVLLGLVAAEATVSLPVSGIAGFGAYEGTWALVFHALGFPASIAQLTSVAHHLFTQAYGYGIGSLALAALLLPCWRRDRPRPVVPAVADSPVAFSAKIATFAVAIASLLWVCWELPVEAGEVTTAEKETESERGARREVADSFRGRIVFDSNRRGTFGIFSVMPDGSDVKPVVDGEWAEVYPDVSGDGRWVTFARAESEVRGAASEIFVAGTDGREPRRVAANGTYPTFSGDGRTIYFERDRRRVMAIGFDGKNERPLFLPADYGFAGREVVKPRVSPDGSMVVFTSDRGGRWHAWGVDLRSKQAFAIGPGCEPSWFPDGRRIAWIRFQARDRAGIFAFDRPSGAASVLEDAGPPRGHEYFPTITADGEFLLYGSAPSGQHSHATANYQIFIKRLADGAVARVTRDRFTNRWPKAVPAG
jgi:hypothetical protein